MADAVQEALERDRVIDITTTGRVSGEPRRIEIWFHNLAGRLYITGMPGRARSWLANLTAEPQFTFHLKSSTKADLPARARVIDEEGERREVLGEILGRLDRGDELERWVSEAPLVEVTLAEAPS